MIVSLMYYFQELIGKLWDFNHHKENWVIEKYSPGRREDKQSNTWGGPRFRRALHLAYTLAFVCLLRVDEVLKIQSHDIEIVTDDLLKVTLPFWKTNQFGCMYIELPSYSLLNILILDIQPFFIKKLLEDLKHLCPVRAYAEWVTQTQINEGFIFHKMDARDRHAADPNKHMV